MPGVWYSAAEWGDYDNDGDLDIALAGTKTGDPSGDWTRVYRSSGALPNSPPSTPGNLHAYREGNQLIATWDPSTDATTPSAGLSYNIRVGSTPGGSDIVNPMAGADGQRRVARIGNAQKRTSWSINVSQPGPYYVAVQAIDAAYAGSAFGTATVGVDGRESSGLDFAVVGANPAQAKARFWFSMPVAGHATIEAFDVLGRVVANIVDEELAAGAHEVSWNFGRAGEKVPAGMYIARLSVGGAFKVRPVVVLN
jgi:hypothetical protein